MPVAPNATGWSPSTKTSRGGVLRRLSNCWELRKTGRRLNNPDAPAARSGRGTSAVEERLDVAIAIGEGRTRGLAAVGLRRIGHQHVGVADIATGGERTDHLDVILHTPRHQETTRESSAPG